MTDQEKLIYDEDTRTTRPMHKGRIRAFGGHARLTRKPEDGHAVEVWEGGRFVGYVKIKPQKKYLPGIR